VCVHLRPFQDAVREALLVAQRRQVRAARRRQPGRPRVEPESAQARPPPRRRLDKSRRGRRRECACCCCCGGRCRGCATGHGGFSQIGRLGGHVVANRTRRRQIGGSSSSSRSIISDNSSSRSSNSSGGVCRGSRGGAIGRGCIAASTRRLRRRPLKSIAFEERQKLRVHGRRRLEEQKRG
jgi:hypothetical protein